jgi:hypothetical protein
MLVGREKEGQAAFSLFILSCGPNEVRYAKRKDLSRGQTQYVHKSKIDG